MVWPFGKENWCNLEGRYLHMVADMSQQIASAENSDTVTVCSVGVFGTKYIRNGEPLPDTIEIIQGQSKTISVQRITSSFEIATELAIQLRQSTDLSFVSITEGESTSDVVIDAANQTFGEYTLTLESFNSLSIAQSALKTDTVVIRIIGPGFADKLGVQVLTEGIATSWTLPEIVEGNFPLDRLVSQASSNIASSITFDESNRVVSYNGLTIESSSSGVFGYITFDLIDTEGSLVSSTQTVIIYPASLEGESEETLEESDQVLVDEPDLPSEESQNDMNAPNE